jgi:hypothetical protein
MGKYGLLFLFLVVLLVNGHAQQIFSIEKNLRQEWMEYDNGLYQVMPDERFTVENTIYIKVDANRFPGRYLAVSSDRSFFIFINGMLSGEVAEKTLMNLDSLTTSYGTASFLIAIHQQGINPRDLKTVIGSFRTHLTPVENTKRPDTYFRDFVVLAGLVIILLFLVIVRLNPKLASDYFSVIRIFSLREGEDAQSNARLTSSTNIQFYIICSLLLGFYLMIIIHHLPDAYALPLYFHGRSFGAVLWQWIRLSTIILGVFFLKIVLIYSLTRLFGLRGITRIHFFNWVRWLLIVFGASSIILFVYFISRGQNVNFFRVFLMLVTVTLTTWIFIVFLKLNGKNEHSMFHLFSYICATEIIPLLITVKVLFQ